MRRYLVHPNPSPLSLEFEDVDKLRPPSIGYCPGEVVLDHVAYPKVFHRDHGVPINVVPRRLVCVVLALPGDLEVLFGNGSCSLLASLRALLTLTVFALCSPKLLGRTPEALRVLDRLAFGVGQEHLEANIQANGWAVFFRLRRICKLTDDEHVPMSIGAQEEVSTLWCSLERAMLFDLQRASELLRHSELAGIGVEVDIPPPAVLPQMYLVPAVCALKARKANLLPKLFAVKEALERLIESVGKGLYGGLWDVLRAGPSAASLEVVREVIAAKKPAGLLVVGFEQRKHFIVEQAAFPQARKEHSALGASWIKPVLERLVHVPTITAI